MSITQSFNAGGTAILTISFVDENGEAMSPNSASWSLYRHGKIVNGREDVAITDYYTEDGKTKADIVLSGNDLVGGEQLVVVQGEYDSTAGTGLTFRTMTTIYVNYIPQG